MYRIYDEQKKKWRDETHEDKEMLLAEFREHWEIVNYDSEYEDIINSDLDEEASKEDVERVMHTRVYGVPAETYLKQQGFTARKYS